MSAFINFLIILFYRAPLEFLVTVLRLLVLLILLLIVLLLWLLRWLISLFKRGKYRERTKKPCGRLPEVLIRRPDPCIYSQQLLRSQGLPVTWNNPDIWMAPTSNPNDIQPDSYHLLEDTSYIASVRVHNASPDPAIGVRVRFAYRPWSFNSPELTPIETDADGNEVFKFVNVPAMSSAIAQFIWHTPAVDEGQDHRHFCLKAFLHHPMDRNPSNNVGQENTNVYSTNPGHVSPGEQVEVAVPLFNPDPEPTQFFFEANLYAIIQQDHHQLKLQTIRGRARMPAYKKVANFLPTLHAKGNFDFRAKQHRPLNIYRYSGYDQIREAVLDQDTALPRGMTVTAGGQPLKEGLILKGKENQNVNFEIKVPETATRGTSLPVNLNAYKKNGVLVGGVSLLLNVKE